VENLVQYALLLLRRNELLLAILFHVSLKSTLVISACLNEVWQHVHFVLGFKGFNIQQLHGSEHVHSVMLALSFNNSAFKFPS